MSNYVIKIDAENPEMLEDDFKNGIQADGFVLMTIVNGEPNAAYMYKVTTQDVSRFFMTSEGSASILRQAAAIAEGYRKAKQIMEEDNAASRPNMIDFLKNFLDSSNEA